MSRVEWELSAQVARGHGRSFDALIAASARQRRLDRLDYLERGALEASAK